MFKKLFKPITSIFAKVGGVAKNASGLDSYKMAPVKFEQKQNMLGNLLMQQAQGKGPSFATETMRTGINEGLSSLRGGLQGGSGMSQGTRNRLYARQAGAGMRSIASQGGMMRAKEMQDARSTLGNFILGSQQAQTQRSSVAQRAHEGKAQRRMKAVDSLGQGVGKLMGMLPIG